MEKQTPEFIDGLIVKHPSDKAPDWVKAKIAIKRIDLINWLESKTEEWINADMKVSAAGKMYIQVDNWKKDHVSGDNPYKQPEQGVEGQTMGNAEAFDDDDINPEDVPF